MTIFLFPHDLLQFILNRFVIAAVAQQRSEIVLRRAEKTGANFPIGHQTDAIAIPTERLAHRRDDADFSFAIGKLPASGRLGFVLGFDRKQLGHSVRRIQ